MIYLLLTYGLLFVGEAFQQDAEAQASFTFDSNVITAQDGYVQLKWTGDEPVTTFELEQSSNANFTDAKTRYSGPDRATFISGLNSGTYYFRVKASDGAWSETLQINVQHQSMRLTYWLMAIGSLVFGATCAVVIVGARNKPPRPN